MGRKWCSFIPVKDFSQFVGNSHNNIDGCHTSSSLRRQLIRQDEAEDVEQADDVTTFVTLLRSCTKHKDLRKGTRLHDDILRHGLLEHCSDALVTMYSKCGALAAAKKLLDMYKSRDVLTWTALIAGYAQKGQGYNALKYFELMQREGLLPNAVTYLCILKACGSIASVDTGEKIHDEISKRGLLKNDVVMGSALVDMYAKCGALTKARQILEELPVRDVVCWTALISGYASEGQGEQALYSFGCMQQDGFSPNAVTFIALLKACGSIGSMDKGEQIHHEIAKQGLLENDIVLGTALVDMYAKCGALAKAWRVLKELPTRNVFSWNALIAGYVQLNKSDEALACFEAIKQDGLTPDAVTFTCILKACGSIGAVDQGDQIKDEISKQRSLANDIVLGNAVVDMYSRCGALAKARNFLEQLPIRNVISWTPLVAGYAQMGEIGEALRCFYQMQSECLTPDASMLSCVLSACSRLGLLEDAGMLFSSMSSRFGFKPDSDHYTCMVDLFGRAGHLDKAVGVIEEMPSSNCDAWSTLLGACLKWGDVNVGRWAFEHSVQVESTNAAVYVLMVNIYMAAGMHEDAHKIEDMSIEYGAWKKQQYM